MATENEQVAGGEQELSLRDQLDAAFEQVATDEAPGNQDEAASAAAEGDDRARDERGRFAPKPEQQDPPAKAPGAMQEPPKPQQGAQAPAAPAAPDLKPPASWKPEAREKWAGVDPDIRAEVHRREGEFQRALHGSAQARQFQDAFERVVAPYELFIRQENSNPLQAVQNLMQTAASLRTDTAPNVVTMMTGLITQFGVGRFGEQFLNALDTALGRARDSGWTGAAAPTGVPQFRDPRLDQFLAQQQQYLAQQAQREEGQMREQLRAFGDSHEFYRDVAGLMADLVEVRARRGEAPDLEKVYAEACKMHEGVSTILAQRTAAAKASSNSQAVLRAKRAAASVKGDTTSDTGATVPKNDSIRAAIEAAFESTGRA